MTPVQRAARTVQTAAENWEAAAIEKCRNDPRVAELRLCPVCMVDHPCLCETDRAIVKMRTYYEANRRTLLRKEPEEIGSWGVKRDALMRGLEKIASAPYEAEIKFLREKQERPT